MATTKRKGRADVVGATAVLRRGFYKRLIEIGCVTCPQCRDYIDPASHVNYCATFAASYRPAA